MPARKKQPTPESNNDSPEDLVVPHAIDLSGADDDEVKEVVEVKQKKASPIKKKAVAKAKAIANKRQIVPGSPDTDQSPSQGIKSVKKKPRRVPVRAITPVEDSVSEDSDNLPVSPSKPPMEKGKGKATALAPRYVLLKLPAKCQIPKDGIDNKLAKEYTNLPNLLYGELLTWNSKPREGFMFFLLWPQLIPDIDMNNVKAAMCLVSFGRYVNPALVSLRKLSALLMGPNSSRKLMQVGTKFAVCLMAVHVGASHLRTPPAWREGLMVTKYISGNPHS
ncbi:hypothetical protein DXG01_004854 [Tephrocybe rancida]|nr:hypothetical protein DXG01_004854 [Tephrocybe rancida]